MIDSNTGAGTYASRIRRSRSGWRWTVRLLPAVLACTFAGAGQARDKFEDLNKAVDKLTELLVLGAKLEGREVLVRPRDFFEMGSGRSLPLSKYLARRFIPALRRHGATPMTVTDDENRAIVLRGEWDIESGSEWLYLFLEIKQLTEGGRLTTSESREGWVPIANIDRKHLEPDLESHGRFVVRQLETDLPGDGKYHLRMQPFKILGQASPEGFSGYLQDGWRPAFTGSRRFTLVGPDAEFDGELDGTVRIEDKYVKISLLVSGRQGQTDAAANAELDKELFRGLLSQGVEGTGDEDDKVIPIVTGGGSPEDEAPDALHRAAEAGDVNGLRAALKAGADMDARDGKGWTALMHAVAKGYPLLVEPLLEARADPDVRAPDGATALFMAADERHTEIIVLLMEAEADVSVRGPKGRKTAVDVARVRYGDAETARREGEPLAVLALLEGMSLDDAAYGRAEALGTAAAYAEYRSLYPKGRHAEEAARRERERTAKRRFRDCAECPELVVVSEGTYMMGSPSSEEGRGGDEGPVHRVTIGRPFAVGVYEVTFGEWDACVSGGGCGGYRPDDGGWGRGPRPVMNVSWVDAKAYVEWLSEETGKTYRLLSESEWEYVARAGTKTARYWGESERGQCRYANGADREAKRHNSGWTTVDCDDGYYRTSPVGRYEANEYKLHDVLGNVWEWVEDCWNGSYSGAPTDGNAWESGDCSRRVVRGGSWSGKPRSLRSAYRGGFATGLRYDYVGFRVARTLTP